MGYRVLIGYRLEVIVASLEEVLYVVPPLGEGNLGHDLVVDAAVYFHDDLCPVLPQGHGQVAPSVEGGGGFGLKEEHGN